MIWQCSRFERNSGGVGLFGQSPPFATFVRQTSHLHMSPRARSRLEYDPGAMGRVSKEFYGVHPGNVPCDTKV